MRGHVASAIALLRVLEVVMPIGVCAIRVMRVGVCAIATPREMVDADRIERGIRKVLLLGDAERGDV